MLMNDVNEMNGLAMANAFLTDGYLNKRVNYCHQDLPRDIEKV